VIRKLSIFALLALTFVCAGCVSLSARLERTVGKTHSASYRSANFDIRYRLGSVPETELARLSALLGGELARISALLELEIKPTDRYTVFLFKDLDEMQVETGRSKEVAGFAWKGACYVALGGNSALVHELVHLIADAKIKERANSFVAEGLASTVFESSGHVDADALAKYYREEGILLPISQFVAAKRLADVQVPNRQLNTYAIAASWMRFLYENFGPEKLKRYYRGVSVEKAFGRDLATLEAAWLDQIARYKISPAERAFLTRDRNEDKMSGDSTLTLVAGTTFSFTIASPPLSPEARIAWTKNGTALSAMKGLKHEFRSLGPTDSGTYALTIEDPEKGMARTEIKIEVVTAADLPPAHVLRLAPN
jgi:hypothetical protein